MKNLTTLLTLFAAITMSAQDATMASAADDSTTTESFSYTVAQIAYLQSFKNDAANTPTIDDEYEIFDVAIGDESLKTDLEFVVYPNPTDDVVNISISKESDEPVTFQILSYKGAVLSSGKLSVERTAISTRFWAVGTYFVKIQQSDRTIKTLGVIKR